ncbi:MAG: hypothetical protein LBK29_03085 [Oscillospiraceae bacterium]|nr:hypothetical protein [Oscillospiraceae bacterium]
MADLEGILEDYGTRLNHAVTVYINGSKFNSDHLFLQSLEFEGSVWSEASVCVLRYRCALLDGFDLHKDFASAKIGVKLKVESGYIKSNSSSVDTIFEGYVYSIGAEIENNYTFLEVSGMDGKIWMMSSKITEMKKDKKKFSEIVSEITTKYSGKFSGGTSVSIKGEPELTSPIYQRDESDFEFLCRLANTTGSFFYVFLGKLFFTSPSVNKSVKLNIAPCVGVKSVKFYANLFGVPKEVEVKAIKKEDISQAEISKAQPSSSIGSGQTAQSLSSNISAPNVISMVSNYSTTPGEAKFLAESKMILRSFFVKCVVKTDFFVGAELGTGTKLKKFGDPFDNNYLTTGIRHVYDGEHSDFFTFLTLQSDSFTPKSPFRI